MGIRSVFGAEGVSPKVATPQTEEQIVSPGEAQILLNELIELRRQASSLEGKRGIEPDAVSDLKDRLNEVEMRLREWVAASKYRDSQAEDLKHFTGETLELATTWIHWVAILFAVVVLAIGFGNFRESQQLKKEIEKDRAELKMEVEGAKKELDSERTKLKLEIEETLKKVNVARDQSADEMAGFKEAVDDERKTSERTRIFVQAVAEHFFSDALLELLSALHKGGALEAAADKELRDKTKEIEARIFLWYPDSNRAEQAIRTLMALGSEAALPDLSGFATGTSMGDNLKALAHQAIIRISERRGAARRPIQVPE
jgi:hypothetical protein